MKSSKNTRTSRKAQSEPISGESHFVTIDTGSSGAICVVVDRKHFVLTPLKGLEPDKILPLLDQAIDYTNNLTAVVIEEPPRFMGTMIPSSRISVLFESFGIMVGYLMANKIKPVRVTPPVWQRDYRESMGVKRGEMKHSQWKKVLTEHAKSHYPCDGLTNQTADALLISRWWLTESSSPTHAKS